MVNKESVFKATLYYLFYHYQDLVERLEVNFFNKRNRSIATKNKNKANIISHPWYITFVKLFFLVSFLRGAAILFFPATISTQVRRIYMLVEHWHFGATTCEGTLFLWSLLLSIFFFTILSNDLQQYKWLALFRMTDRPESDYLHSKVAGLTFSDYRKFARFRKMVILYYHSIFFNVFPACSVAMLVLIIKVGLFTSHPIWAYFYTFLYCLFVYLSCSGLYTLFLSFILTARYIQIKQYTLGENCASSYAYLVNQVKLYEGHQKGNEVAIGSSRNNRFLAIYDLGTFHKRHADYVTLFDELTDYNRFWDRYLSAVFLVYSTVVAFALYIVLYTNLIWYLNLCYAVAFANHALNMSVIIALCGQVASQQQKWAFRCASFTGRLGAAKGGVFNFKQVLKLNINVNEGVTQLNKAGFVLSNGRQITHQTFQAIIANIGFYFVLTLQNVLYGS